MGKASEYLRFPWRSRAIAATSRSTRCSRFRRLTPRGRTGGRRGACLRMPISSGAPSSTTSARRSPSSCLRGSTCSGWPGCASPPAAARLRGLAAALAPAHQLDRSDSCWSPASALVFAAHERLLLPRDRPLAARNGGSDRVHRPGRAGAPRRAHRPATSLLSPPHSPVSTCSPTLASAGPPPAWRSRSPTPHSSPPTSSGASHGSPPDDGGIDASLQPCCSLSCSSRRSAASTLHVRSPTRCSRRGNRRRHLLVGHPVCLRPAGDGAPRAGVLCALRRVAARDRSRDRRDHPLAAPPRLDLVGIALVTLGVVLHRSEGGARDGAGRLGVDGLQSRGSRSG